jgi:surface antigen
MFALVNWIVNLPFMLVGLFVKIFYKGIFRPVRKILWRIIWYSVYFFLLKPIRLLYLGGGIICVIAVVVAFSFTDSGDAPPLPELEGSSTQTAKTKDAPPRSMESVATLPAMVGEVKNANSAFAKPLMEVMEPYDLQSYSSYFYHAMSYAKAGEPYRWMASDTFFGEIIAEGAFKAKSGIYCRRFTETISYRGANERFKGSSCQRDAQSWCKLRPSSALTCGIDKPNGIMLFFKKWL